MSMNNLRGIGDQSLRFQWLICAESMVNPSGFADQSKRNIQKQTTISESAYAFNEYIVLASSLDDSISFEEILELYRFRWQVELYFKRLKSILDYGEMPKKSEKSIFAWLNGKLMISLLIETLIGKVDFSPSGDCFEEYMERDEVC